MLTKERTTSFLCAIVICAICLLGLTACGDAGPTTADTSTGPAPAPAPGPGSLTITTTPLPNGIVNQGYSASLSGSGGTTPYTWSVSPALRANLSLNTATGAITGTPTTQGTTSHTFTLRDSSNPAQSVQQTLNLTINAATAVLTITTTTLAAGTVGQAYNRAVQTSGGTAPLTFSLVAGAGTLPAGLNISPTTGAIAGTPTAAGTSSFTVRVQDAGGLSDTQALSITINLPAGPTITTTTLPAGTLGQSYNQTVHATGGLGSLTWNISAGTLPANVNLDQVTGVISGTPTLAGTSSFTVRVQDAALQSDTQQLSIVINLINPPDITTTSLPGGTVGQAYNQTLLATGGMGIVTWTISGGSLPAMLSLSPGGVISGTPTTAGTANFTVKATDTLNQSDTQALSIVVSAVLTITTGSLPDAEVGKGYNKDVQSAGGIAPFTWSVTPPLPGDLTMDVSTGRVTGTPAAGTDGEYSLTFTVQDSSSTPQIATRTLSLKIKP